MFRVFKEDPLRMAGENDHLLLVAVEAEERVCLQQHHLPYKIKPNFLRKQFVKTEYGVDNGIRGRPKLTAHPWN